MPSGDGTIELITLRFDGGLADEHALLLTDYSVSLAGMRDLISVVTTLVLRNDYKTTNLRLDEAIRVEARIEREGSWEFVIGIALGVATNAIWDGIKLGAPWSAKRLARLYRAVIRIHKEGKRISRDVNKLAALHEELANEYGVYLEPATTSGDTGQLPLVALDEPPLSALDDDAADEDEVDDSPNVSRVPRHHAYVESVDRALKAIARPIGSSCRSIEVIETSTGERETIDANDKIAIDSALTLFPTDGGWKERPIKFVRINRKTGRALFYYALDPAGEDNAHYSVIIDDQVRRASNVYTEAFSKDAALTVFIRQTLPERGRINSLWEITVEKPEEQLLERR